MLGPIKFGQVLKQVDILSSKQNFKENPMKNPCFFQFKEIEIYMVKNQSKENPMEKGFKINFSSLTNLIPFNNKNYFSFFQGGM